MKCLIWLTWPLQLMWKCWISTLRLASLFAALSAPGCCSDCYYTMVSLWLSCIRTDYLLLSTYCWLNPNASILPTWQPCASYKAVQQEENYHNVVICFPCKGVIVFVSPWGAQQSRWVSVKRSRDILTRRSMATRAERKGVCSSHSESMWTLWSSNDGTGAWHD